MKVQEYIKENGESPYRKWFDSLDEQAATKVSIARSRLEVGNTSSIKWFDGIGEYKIDWGPGYRIYLMSVSEVTISKATGIKNDAITKTVTRKCIELELSCKLR